MVDTLVAMRWLDRKWHKVVEKKLIEFENEPFGEIIVHGGNDISGEEANSDVRKERMKEVTKVVFLLKITKVGDRACKYASNLVVVDIPEGITIIELGEEAFYNCRSLTEVKIPDSLQTFGSHVFLNCSELVLGDSDLYIHIFEDMHGYNEDLTPHVIAYLRSIE
ncbi:hypothetical protein TrST_g1941 [Triparma strigata]|nr:hypothetical protein TrST_g1941 [Triparma strigata]